MSLQKEQQGTPITAYQRDLVNGTKALRVGKEVPEGDINLAYMHTPTIQSDENISLIRTSYTSDNVIPQDQLESMVTANEQGILEYVDMIGNEEVHSRPPKDIFPSKKISLTRQFKKNDMRTENALYYKFEIDYHYDSQLAAPDEKGLYFVRKYTGQQIELTDENGHLLDDTYKYEIYVQPQAINPRIYSVLIYLHKNTDTINTIKVRYNHIDQVVKDEHVYSVQKQLELYTNQANQITLDHQVKQMLESGKLRTINGISAFEERPEVEVLQAIANEENDKEIFAITPKTDGAGYQIIVPQKSESDPRISRIFSHRVVAQYIGSDNQTVKVTVGHITDWCMNPEALMKNEQEEYSGEWKNIGMPYGGGKLNAKEMIEMSLPFGTPSIPADATYSIEDDKGNLLYHIKILHDNADVNTEVNEVMSKTVEAKANGLIQEPWKNAMQSNTVIKNNPIPHVCSIIPERQQTKLNFKWKANGQGYTESKTTYSTDWKVCADVEFKKTTIPNTLDILDQTKWDIIGDPANKNNWKYAYSSILGKNALSYTVNDGYINGFFQRKEVIDGSLVDLMNKTDYEFSVKVRITETDDDPIVILFRVQNTQDYYMFLWDGETLTSGLTSGAYGRVYVGEYGWTGFQWFEYNNTYNDWRHAKTKEEYLQMGFGTQHKRIIKVSPSTLPAFTGTNYATWDGTTRYPGDQTNSRFDDITTKDDLYTSTLGSKGFVAGKDYKITIKVIGNHFQVYINENVNNSDLGNLVCQAIDSTYQQGTYGIAVLHEKDTLWYDMNMTEIAAETICTTSESITLVDTTEKKLSNYRVVDMMESLIKDHADTLYAGSPYTIRGYNPYSSGDLILRIDPIDGFLYGKTNNSLAGGIGQTPWTTDANGLSVDGTGEVEYHADGHYTILVQPSTLPSNLIPSNILGFVWNPPILTEGSNVSLTLGNPDKIQVTASVPPISVIGLPYVLQQKNILKSDGLSIIENLQDFYNKLEIPDSIPKEEILLRIERGIVTGVGVDGTATTQNPEYRVNYRFQCQKNGYTRMPVDQFQDQLGVNRLRLKSIVKENNLLDPDMTVNIVAWTTFEDLEAVPLFAIKIEEERKIEIEKPKVEQSRMEIDNWYLRVKNGLFLKRLRLPYMEIESAEKLPEIYLTYPQLLGMVTSPEQVVEIDLEYRLPEYTNQSFYNRPFLLMDKEKPTVLNEYAIQTRYAPLVLSSETNKSYLEVYSLRGEQRRILRVSDVDAAKGIIYLHDRIREQDTVYVRYAYQEDWYTYRGFMKDASNFFHLDLNPTPGHRHTVAEHGFHQWIPIDNNQEVFTIRPEGTDNRTLLAKPIHIYMRPYALRYVDQSNPLKDGQIIPGTLRDKTLYHTDEEWWFNPQDYKYDPTMFRLGKVILQENSIMKENMTILDTRTRGGGLDESLSKEIIRQVNKESLYHWDVGYFDGEAYQENGVIVVQLPRAILQSETNPNGFKEAEVQAAIAKHKGYGILPIIEFYDEEIDEYRYNIIPNPEFLEGKDIGYYDPLHSKGTYSIRYISLGAGDNYVLQIENDAEYAITIPGYKFKDNRYRLDVKAVKESTATIRSAGTIDVYYKDGTSIRTQLGTINRDQWMIYKDYISINPNIHHVTITLNKTAEVRTGRIIYDYIKIVPSPDLTQQTIEIHEI